MGKKKYINYLPRIDPRILLWIMGFIFLVLFVMAIQNTCFNEQEFKITKEECWNETQQEHLILEGEHWDYISNLKCHKIKYF